MEKEKNFSVFSFILITLNLIVIIGIGIGVAYFYNFIQVNNLTVEEGIQEAKVQFQKAIRNADKSNNIELTPLDDKDTLTYKVRPEKIESDYFYYNQLSENGKVIYNTIEGNLDKMKSGTYTIDFGTKFNDLLQSEEGKAELKVDFQAAWDALALDNPKIYFVDVTKLFLTVETATTGNTKICTTYIGPAENSNYLIDGINPDDIDAQETRLEGIKANVVQSVSGSDYNKIQQIHDVLVDELEYDQSLNRVHTHDIYGALVEKCVVCEGYAKAFKYLLDGVGIPCVLVSGTGKNSKGQTEEHIWNYVNLDGKWYAVDVTWDDPIITGGVLTNKLRYQYFLKGSSSFNDNHTANHYLSKNSFKFEYPKLNTSDY